MKNPFRFVQPTPEKLTAMEAVRNNFLFVLGQIENYCPVGRERSLAITNLEQACMWAVKAIGVEGEE